MVMPRICYERAFRVYFSLHHLGRHQALEQFRMPSLLRGDEYQVVYSREFLARFLLAKQINLITNQQKIQLLLRDQRMQLQHFLPLLRHIKQVQHQISLLHLLHTPLHPRSLYHITRMLTYAGRIDQPEQYPVNIEHLLYRIPRRARYVADNRPILIEQNVEQGGLSRIWLSDYCHTHPIFYHIAQPERFHQPISRGPYLSYEFYKLLPVGKLNILLGEIELEFYQRGKLHQPLTQFL